MTRVERFSRISLRYISSSCKSRIKRAGDKSVRMGSRVRDSRSHSRRGIRNGRGRLAYLRSTALPINRPGLQPISRARRIVRPDRRFNSSRRDNRDRPQTSWLRLSKSGPRVHHRAHSSEAIKFYYPVPMILIWRRMRISYTSSVDVSSHLCSPWFHVYYL